MAISRALALQSEAEIASRRLHQMAGATAGKTAARLLCLRKSFSTTHSVRPRVLPAVTRYFIPILISAKSSLRYRLSRCAGITACAGSGGVLARHNASHDAQLI